MAKLNQILAIEKGIKADSYSALTEYHKLIQKPELFAGFKKEYQSNSDDGDKLQPEGKKVQFVVTEILRTVEKEQSKLLNIIVRKDLTNCVAKAPVMLDGVQLIPDVPVSYLLFLEKQLNDLRDIIAKLPILDSGDEWKPDESTGLSRTDEVKTHRTKKLQRPIVLYEATDKHPAQTQLITEDVIEGYWSTVKFSGAIRRPDKLAMIERVEKLQQAVKIAREAANIQDEEPSPDVGKAIFGYLMPKEA